MPTSPLFSSLKDDTAWFETWFDSPYYHLLYRHRDTKEAQFFIRNVVKALHLQAGQRVLDLACGKGRHAIFLNQEAQLDVTGVDLSPQNIKGATQAYANENLSFAVHDMREVFRPQYFDAILNLFTSFGYFETQAENAQVIHSAAQGLKAKGKLLVDFLNPAYVVANLKSEDIQTHEGIQFRIKRAIEEGYIVKDIQFEDQGEAYHFQERVKVIHLEEFQTYFEEAGLRLCNIWGDYSLANFDPEQSERLILVGEKVKA